MKELLEAWYALLNAQVSYNGNTIDVYVEDAPETQDTHYILLRGEGGTDNSNKSNFADDVTVVVDIVTIFKNNVDRSVAESIGSQIHSALFDGPGLHNLTEPSGKQFLNVIRETFDYLREQDGINNYYRKVARYTTRVLTT